MHGYRAIVVSIGFEEKYAIRSLTRHGLDKGDRILLLTGPLVERTIKTLNFIKDFVTKYFSSEVSLRICEIPVHEFSMALSVVKKAIADDVKGAREVIVNLSGGMKVVAFATLMAIAQLKPSNVLIEVELEDSSTVVQIPTLLLNPPSIEGAKLEVLRKLIERGGEVSVRELAKSLGKDASTIRRYLIELRKLRLVTIKRNRPLTVEALALANALV